MQIISVFIFARINGHHPFPCIIKNRIPFACYCHIFTFDFGYTEVEPPLLFILEGGIFWLIVRVIFTGFNINITFLISWKSYVVFFHLAWHRWPTTLLDVELIEENDMGECQIWKLFFFVTGSFMTYFHLFPFVNNKQYGEGKMSQAVVFVYIIAFNFAPTLFPLEVC